MTWVVTGLGNPGPEYENTRHNAGRMAVMHYAKYASAPAWKEDKKSQSLTTGATVKTTLVALQLPNTFMNKSGSAVMKLVKGVKAAERLIVVYDDLDLPIGKIKLSFDRGSGGHNGVESIMTALKTKKFTRIRIGISPHTPGGKIKKPDSGSVVDDFILKKFKESELDELKKVFKRVAEAIDVIVAEGPMIAMNHFN
ncbi:MAG: aminoacyl-tRNA hydrolase [Candidatus Pacebacteria bacterium]|nr:aminoacyl-tRNA hydrolase [Candidatus Paceibacterota bacterium]